MEELNARIVMELTEIVLYCHTCEYRALELLKVANCIFDKDEFFKAVASYTKFKSNMDLFEKLLSQVDEPITMLQVVVIKSMINQLKTDFENVVEMLEEADARIDQDRIDFEAATLLNEMLDRVELDIVDFDSFEEALRARYFITYLLEETDEGYDPRYGGLTVLMVASFKTKRAAFTYALKHGISRDMVWSMYT